MENMFMYAIVNGEIIINSLSDRTTANALFTTLRNDEYTTAIATMKDGIVRFWKGNEMDWFVPVVESREVFRSWHETDAFGVRVLSYWEELTVIHTGYKARKLPLITYGKTYTITKEFCESNKRKFNKYTFWSEKGEVLSSYCEEYKKREN